MLILLPNGHRVHRDHVVRVFTVPLQKLIGVPGMSFPPCVKIELSTGAQITAVQCETHDEAETKAAEIAKLMFSDDDNLPPSAR